MSLLSNMSCLIFVWEHKNFQLSLSQPCRSAVTSSYVFITPTLHIYVITNSSFLDLVGRGSAKSIHRLHGGFEVCSWASCFLQIFRYLLHWFQHKNTKVTFKTRKFSPKDLSKWVSDIYFCYDCHLLFHLYWLQK